MGLQEHFEEILKQNQVNQMLPKNIVEALLFFSKEALSAAPAETLCFSYFWGEIFPNI